MYIYTCVYYFCTPRKVWDFSAKLGDFPFVGCLSWMIGGLVQQQGSPKSTG